MTITLTHIVVLVVIIIPIYVFILGKIFAAGWVQGIKQLVFKDREGEEHGER